MVSRMKQSMKIILLSSFAIIATLPVPASYAQDKQMGQAREALEITADTALEWNQTEKTYLARGNAVAKQGDTSVKADILKAQYKGESNSTSDIHLLSAEGNVILKSGMDIATGDKAIYNLISGEAVISGGRPKIINQNKNTLEANKITVWTKDSVIIKAEALGQVIATNGVQTATAKKATYLPLETMIELTGQVKIKQDKNLLEGEKAQMNLSTRISTMTGQSKTDRVKAVFYTDTKN
jgi:lipopolysaccharide export system protein LptA